MEQETQVRFDNSEINHYFLKYIDFDEYCDIEKRLKTGTSFVAVFSQGGKDIFAVVYDINHHVKELNVRHVGGFFSKRYTLLDTVSEALAKYFKLEFINFKTTRRAVVKLAEKANYTPLPETNEFRRVLH